MSTKMKCYQFECGTVKGVECGRSAGSAWRKLLRRTGDNDLFAELVRFREVRLTGKRMIAVGIWLYQEPLALQDGLR